MDLIIDDEFQVLIPPLSSKEYQVLEENILKDGCRDPLVLWNGILVDGHNRYTICTKHNLEFNTIEKNFDSRIDVYVWIIQNQLGISKINSEDAIYRLLLGQNWESN